MYTEVSITRFNSSALALDFTAYTRDMRCTSPKIVVQRVRSGDIGGQATGPCRSVRRMIWTGIFSNTGSPFSRKRR